MTHPTIERLQKFTNLELVTAYGNSNDKQWKHEVVNEMNYRIHLGTFKAPQGVYNYEAYMNRNRGNAGVRDHAAPTYWELVHGGATYAQPSLFEWLTSVWQNRSWNK